MTAVIAVFAACTPGSEPPPFGGPTPTSTPAPTAIPPAVTLSSTTLAFTNVGAAFAQNVSVSQMNYSGNFTPSTTSCNGIATIAAASSTTFTVTPVAAGSCTFTISGGNAQSATLSVGVTTTSIGGN